MLLDGLASGEPEEVTPDYLDALTSEAEETIVGCGRQGAIVFNRNDYRA
jgi:hypothetical protein